ncbi:MAG: cell division protein SepF, partial [Mycobacterium sp.]
MSTLHKVKAYFGMAPMEDYDDEYYDDRVPTRGGYSRQRFADDGYGRYEDRFDGRDYDDPRGEPSDYPSGSYRGGYPDEHRFRSHDYDRSELARPRFGSLRGST